MMAGPKAITGKIAKVDKKPAVKSSDSKSSGLSAAEKKAIAAGLGNVAKDTTKVLGLLGQYLAGGAEGTVGGGISGYSSDKDYLGSDRTGTSSTGKNYINGKLVSPEEWTKFLYGDNKNTGDGTPQEDTTANLLKAQAQAERQSAYDILLAEFNRYGLSALVEPLKGFIISGASPAELTIQLQNTDAYKKRFAANEQRIAKGLAALSPAEYVAVEDQYQNIMRNYGLPESYYAKDTMGTQAGFQTLLANDVSATELEERVLTAQDRVLKAAPEVSQALKAFYPDITNGDILAYTLDPQKGLDSIKRKVTAAEIGGAAIGQGLKTDVTRAEQLAAAGVTKQQAQEGYQTIAEVAPRGEMLSDIYKQSPYGQTQAEQEIFNLAGSAEAAKQRKKLTSLETAAFSGQAGVGALARERAGNL
jgi:hypothetical protein